VAAESLLLGLATEVVRLIPDLIKAIRSGNSQLARDLAEEAAQRQAFVALQNRKRKAARKS
jgi:hypothetical protein